MIDTRSLELVDPEISDLVAAEATRQRNHIQLIASENFVSRAVMEAVGSVFTNKYSEGYPGRRYYEGCVVVDEVEVLAVERAKALFGSDHANVQPHSGAQANMAAYFALLEPGDTVLGMRLDQGGHLTHGSPVNFSGKLFNFISYGLDRETELVDLDVVRDLALEHQPKLIVAGYSAYSRILDWEGFRAVADEVGAYFMVDAAHIIGLIAGGAHPDPVPHADIVTSTTHKALRGPRGGLILCREEFAKAIDKAVFPDTQGGPLNQQIAGKAVCFREAATPEYGAYAHQVVRNAAALAETMAGEGVRIVSGGTDNHMFLADMRSIDEELTGKTAAATLEAIGITTNRNAIPYDPRKPFITSGLRIGTPAATTAGLKQEQMVMLGRILVEVLRSHADEVRLKVLAEEVADLAHQFPGYPKDFPGHV